MNSNIKPNRTLLIALFTFILALGFTSTALAYEFDQPNYGDPIIVNGDILDWDLVADHFSVMYQDADTNGVVVADAYLRYNHAESMLYVLMRSRGGQNVRTINGQLVGVDGDIVIERPYLLPDGSPRPDFAWFNPNGDGTLAEGWEAAVPFGEDNYQILIHAIFLDQVKAWVELPLYVFRLDYGDLPDTYRTLDASSGPKHSAGRLRLGPQVDGESDGQPQNNPILDDLNGRNDEDGVFPIGNWRTGTPTFQYTVNGCANTCYLNAWVDWEDDGGFDTGDVLFTNLQVSNGTFNYSFNLPDGTIFPSTFNTRFRICDAMAGCATPLALSLEDAPLGEVEDYQWSFTPNAVTLNSFSAAPIKNPTILYLLVGSVAAIMILGTATFIQKRKSR